MPGNKWRKLTHNLEAARQGGYRTLLTFGGAYSSHVRATAAAGAIYGFATIGVIRGEEHRPLNPSLRYAADCGMRLIYLDRASYRRKASAQITGALPVRLPVLGPGIVDSRDDDHLRGAGRVSGRGHGRLASATR